MIDIYISDKVIFLPCSEVREHDSMTGRFRFFTFHVMIDNIYQENDRPKSKNADSCNYLSYR
jgi:hypothetical protein